MIRFLNLIKQFPNRIVKFFRKLLWRKKIYNQIDELQKNSLNRKKKMNKNIDSRIILKVIKHGKGKHDIDYLHILSNRKLLRGNKFKSMRDFEDKATIMWIRIHETSKNPYNYKIDWKDFEWELTCSNKLSYDLFINTLNDCIRIDDRDTDFIIEDLDLIKSLRYFESFDKYGLIKTKGKLPLIKWKDENRILSIGRRIYNEINKRIRGEKQ